MGELNKKSEMNNYKKGIGQKKNSEIRNKSKKENE